MPHILEKTPFSADLLPAVRDFDCGDSEAAQEVAEWIRGPVLEDLGPLCQVWLYSTEQHGLVGFSSLGERAWRYPNSKKSDHAPINTIPWIGIRKELQGMPREQPEARFFRQILAHIATEASRHTERLPLTGLFVRLRNPAIGAYKRFGFEEFPPPYTDRETKIVYTRMIVEQPVLAERASLPDWWPTPEGGASAGF